jgi:hypothetical protein
MAIKSQLSMTNFVMEMLDKDYKKINLSGQTAKDTHDATEVLSHGETEGEFPYDQLFPAYYLSFAPSARNNKEKAR